MTITRNVTVDLCGGARIETRATWGGLALRARLWPCGGDDFARVDVAFAEAALLGHHGDPDGSEVDVSLSSGKAKMTLRSTVDTDDMLRRFTERTMRPPYLYTGMRCHVAVGGYWQPAAVTTAFGDAAYVRLASGRAANDEHFVLISDIRVPVGKAGER